MELEETKKKDMETMEYQQMQIKKSFDGKARAK